MIESFSEWRKALIEEDKSLGLNDVKRPPGELRKMYRRYKEHNLKRSSANRWR